jgi:DnaJ domain
LPDPYHTLGVARNCSREEVVAAFRDKVWLAHPDRGGDEQAFIELCAAYQAILSDIRPTPRGPRPGRADRIARPPGRPAPDETRIPKHPRRPDHEKRRPKVPDKDWKPELILGADVGRNGQPAPAADPTWEPDLILADLAAAQRRPSQPPDPNWKADVILDDLPVEYDAGKPVASSPGSPAAYLSLLQRISAGPPEHSDQGSFTELKQLLRALLVFIFVAWVVGTIWLCKVMWDESNEAAREPARGQLQATPR